MKMSAAQRQYGAVLLMLLMLIAVGALSVFVTELGRPGRGHDRDAITIAALAQAREALLARSALDANHPGSLPCPDGDDDGSADLLVGNECPAYLGRLPWRTLSLPDLRDGGSERLWYALSRNFVDDNSRTINGATLGQITVRNTGGNVVLDGDAGAASGAVALLIAPGGIIARQGDASAQLRGCSVGINCDSDLKCTAAPHSATPKCNPVNYLDRTSGEDNADFVQGDSGNGFVMGPIFDARRDLVVNDRLLALTRRDLLAAVERRVAGTIKSALPHPYPGTLETVPVPDWFVANGWAAGMAYAKLTDDTATMVFADCPARVYTITWDAAPGGSKLSWAGAC